MAKRRKKAIEENHTSLFTESDPDPLAGFLPVVSEWFRNEIGSPTEAQAKGWPSIQSGQNTLIVAPTGSGKTLAAFMASLDALWRQTDLEQGVQVLYISPLKALNQDIHRNLDRPLEGVVRWASESGLSLPRIRTAVRTGDTHQNERQAQARKPPHVLITTPESLHLILGSKSRNMLSTVRWVIVDELHALAGQKRGTFLAILLERLHEFLQKEFVRIGLTATVNPLEEAGRFLSGYLPDLQSPHVFQPRPVNIVRTVVNKQWDLLVQRAEVNPDPNEPRSIWPSLEKELADLIDSHRSTLIFANNRYQVERLTAKLNELREESIEQQPELADVHQQENLVKDELKVDEKEAESESGIHPVSSFVHAHHGSISLERRRQTELALKEGNLKGVISTASLEMGIDMGAVDLVCQIGSPGEVARGLQRVGRAGHGVGQISKGRFFAKTNADLLETAALVEAMSRSAVEPLSIPQNCLDMLAQQIVACVAVCPWKPRELLALFRRSYPYRNLTDQAFEAVLEMLSGRFRVEAIRDLKARIFWDRIRDELSALPGTSSMALTGGGAIPDTGQYPVKLGEQGPTLGSLDEEFVLERRPGESFRLGSSTWRIDRIEADRVIVSPTGGGEMVVMPFWRGEESRRSATLGHAIGSLVRRIATDADYEESEKLLMQDCRLNKESACDLIRFIRRQQRVVKAVPDDQTIVIEAFRDPSGEIALAVLSPWGGRFHQALKLVLQNRLNEQYGFRPAAQHADDGLLMRLPQDVAERPPLDILDGLNFEEAFARLQTELVDSALFGLRFRQNAARSLLLPRPDPGKRTPLWLQRLRSKDLLQVVRQMPDFPIVLECYRECLSQDLDLDLLRRILDEIASGTVRVVKHMGESASPFASDLMYRFERKFLYEWDTPHQNQESRSRNRTSETLPGPVLQELLDPRVMQRLDDQRLDDWNRPLRTAEELAERMQRLGDLAESEVSPEHRPFLMELKDRQIVECLFQNANCETIWILSEEFPLYQSAFPSGFVKSSEIVFNENRENALNHVLKRFVSRRTLISLNDLTNRYPLERIVGEDWLQRWTERGGFVRLSADSSSDGIARWADARQMQRMVKMSQSERRRDIQSIKPEVWVSWVLHKNFCAETTSNFNSADRLSKSILGLQGWAATYSQWTEEILLARVPGFQLADLDRLLETGDFYWQVEPENRASGDQRKLAFWHRDFPLNSNSEVGIEGLSELASLILRKLNSDGSATSMQLRENNNILISDFRSAILELLDQGYITNEKIGFLKQWNSSSENPKKAFRETSPTKATPKSRRINGFRQLLAQQGVGGGGRGHGIRALHHADTVAEGRWKIVPRPTQTNDEDRFAAWTALLLERFGVICRETVRFANPQLDWSAYADWLESAEWRDEIRRGYIVEGLSGLQYSDSDFIQDIYHFSVGFSQSNQNPKFYLLTATDPLNLYGASAPLDLPLLENGRVRLPRISGNLLVMHQGMPVWIIQERGKRLTSLPFADLETQKAALSFFVRNFIHSSLKWSIITLDDDHAAKSRWVEYLTEMGFFRDGLMLTRYQGIV